MIQQIYIWFEETFNSQPKKRGFSYKLILKMHRNPLIAFSIC